MNRRHLTITTHRARIEEQEVTSMPQATCPVCGTRCRIMGDPSSVTRWYEPVGQSELEAANDHALSLETLIESLRIDRNAATARIVELEAACRELLSAAIVKQTKKKLTFSLPPAFENAIRMAAAALAQSTEARP